MADKTLHRKLKSELYESHWKPVLNSGGREEWAVPAPLVSPVMIILNDTNIIMSKYMQTT
jgi:hypothetical protein